MSSIAKKRSLKVGLPPGSLVHIGEIFHPEIEISLIDYDATHCIEKDHLTIQECLKFLKKPSVSWINIRGIHDKDVLNAIGTHFGLHPLVLEDVMNTSQRSKMDDYKDYIFIVMRMLMYNETTDCVEDQQVSVVLGNNFVISFLEDGETVFNPIRNRIRSETSKIRSLGADYLCYSLVDSVVDNYFVILEAVDKKLEDLEESLMGTPAKNTMQKIQHLKREIILLRKSVWPMRDLINDLRRSENPLIKETTKVYLHDVYDHTIQAIDTIESLRDLSSGMLDIYLSRISQHLNEIMKVLTVLATIFVPLTFIASLYGMNFDYMPELHSKWGYPAVLGVMLSISFLMLYYFHRKKWL